MFTRILLFSILTVLLSPGSLLSTVGDVEKTLPSPAPCPTGMTWDGRHLWIADRKTDLIYKIDPEDGSVLSSLPSPGYWPMGLAWDGKCLWNADLEEKKIYQIDPERGLVLKVIDSPTPSPRGLAWDGHYLWVCDDRADRIHQISLEDGTTIVDFPSPASHPQGLAYDGRYLWVSDRVKDEIYLVTPDKGEVIMILSAPGPYARGLAWDGRHLWNIDYQTDEIYKLRIHDPGFFSLKNEREATVELTHQFRNYGPGTVKTLDVYFALPVDLKNQKLQEKPEFDPQPTDFPVDQWGQKVAHFHYENLEAGKIIDSKMRVRLKTYEIWYYIFPEKVGSLEDIPEDIRKKYLVDGSKFQIHHPLIQKAAREAVGGEKNPYWIARKIFDYVIEHMRYELAGGWNVAPKVLKRGTGSCSEYSFVYIALCRASGLPARYAGSVVVRGDDASLDNVFHRWVEVYLPNYGWIPVDPSAGDTPSSRGQARAFGHLSNRFLITTLGGGGSKYLGWNYNFQERWTSQGKCKVHVESIAEWEPITEER